MSRFSSLPPSPFQGHPSDPSEPLPRPLPRPLSTTKASPSPEEIEAARERRQKIIAEAVASRKTTAEPLPRFTRKSDRTAKLRIFVADERTQKRRAKSAPWLAEAVSMLPDMPGSGTGKEKESRPFASFYLPLVLRRLLSADSVENWFISHAGRYLEDCEAHIRRLEMGWADVMLFEVAPGTDLGKGRLCFSVIADPNPESPAQMGWNWTGERLVRPLWVREIYERERLRRLKIPPLNNSDRLPEYAVGRGLPGQLFDEVMRHFETPEEGWITLCTGDSVPFVDWRSHAFHLGLRVRSKLAAVVDVDLDNGKLKWKDAETLARFPEPGFREPGKEITTLTIGCKGSVRHKLKAPQLLWAYMTGVVPAETGRIIHVRDRLERGTLDGVWNLQAFGQVLGTTDPGEVDPTYQKEWRDLAGRVQGGPIILPKGETLASMGIDETNLPIEEDRRFALRWAVHVAGLFYRRVASWAWGEPAQAAAAAYQGMQLAISKQFTHEVMVGLGWLTEEEWALQYTKKPFALQNLRILVEARYRRGSQALHDAHRDGLRHPEMVLNWKEYLQWLVQEAMLEVFQFDRHANHVPPWIAQGQADMSDLIRQRFSELDDPLSAASLATDNLPGIAASLGGL